MPTMNVRNHILPEAKILYFSALSLARRKDPSGLSSAVPPGFALVGVHELLKLPPHLLNFVHIEACYFL